jgi:TIGR03009 family protein
MTRIFARLLVPTVLITLAFIALAAAASAQQAEQHWQATPNYPSNSAPSYQPPQGQGNYPSYPQGQQPGQSYPTIERRDGTQPPQPQYGPPVQGDNRQAYPQYPPVQNTTVQNPAMQGAPQGPIQGPPIQGPQIQGPPVQAAPSQPPAPPFRLSPQEAVALENLLTDWETRNKEIHLLESKFFRWKYDAVFGQAGQAPPPPDEGELKFASPDKAWMHVKTKDSNHPDASEQWLCDGRSVFQWDYKEKIVHEWLMPPELQGKGIGDGPLPFVFGIEAQKLKQRYWMHIITPPDVQNQVWLEAYPKWQPDATNYSKVEVILQIVGDTHTLFPYAIQIYSPNGKDRIVYQLQNPIINPRGNFLTELVGGDWTKPSVGFGWTRKVEVPQRAAAPQSGMNAGMLRR